MREVERKFLVRRVDWSNPEIDRKRVRQIVQGYVFVSGEELRVRQEGERYTMTMKSDGTLSREEWETEIPSWVFHTAMAHTGTACLEKVRYTVDGKECVLMIDVYGGRHTGLVVLEVEFRGDHSEEDAMRFVVPQWAAVEREVTEDKRYKNKNLAQYGIPTPVS